MATTPANSPANAAPQLQGYRSGSRRENPRCCMPPAGIYGPTSGQADIQGRIDPVFDLGVSMDPEVTGYENVVIRGLFLGMTRRQMRSRMAEIAEFSELGDYLPMPSRTYSGIRIRLALGWSSRSIRRPCCWTRESARSTRTSWIGHELGCTLSWIAPASWSSRRTRSSCGRTSVPRHCGWTPAASPDPDRIAR